MENLKFVEILLVEDNPGDARLTQEALNDGIAILEKQPIEFRNSDSLVSAYFEVGDAYLSRGDYSQAKIFLDKAIAVAQKIKSPLLYELENERKKLG